MKNNYPSFSSKTVLALACFLLLGAQLSAQTVSGVVRSAEDNNPIPGAAVLIKNTTRGTITDVDGIFQINVNRGDTLQVSFVGYETKEIGIQDVDITLQIVLDPALSSILDEVVVVGYGSLRKADITSAVAEVDLKTMENLPIANASRLLQGQAAGVQVNQITGIPGQEFTVRIRGLSSLGAGSEPLYVIDGFPVGNQLSQILNPNDIESITILKDAASTAVYGARGANGVVLINTKGATSGVSKISFSASAGIQNIPQSRRIPVLSAQEFVQFQNERISDDIRRNEGREPLPDEIPEAWRFPDQEIPSTSWYDEILNDNAIMQDYNLSISSGARKTKTFLSLGYLNQEGAVIGTDFDRYTARINLTNDFNEMIDIAWNLSGSYSTRNEPGNFFGGFTNAIINTALLMDPRDPVYNEDGSYNAYIGGRDGVFGYPNPVQRLNEEVNYSSEGVLLSNGSISIEPMEGLVFKSLVNVSLNNGRNRQWRPSTIAGWNVPPPRQARASEGTFNTINYGIDNLLSYTKDMEDHNVDFTAGYVFQKETTNSTTATGTLFPDDEIPYVSAAAETTSVTNVSEWSLAAFFGRISYSYLDRFLMSATYRREGSSRFGENNRWGDFPSVSVGWRISEENFFPQSNAITDLKVRASWGITGNNNIGNYSHLARLSAANYVLGEQLAGGKELARFGNPDLSWETSSQVDIGFDLVLFEGKITLVTELYRRITEDMLLPVEIPAHSGFTTALSNVGEVRNQGLEIGLNYRETVGEVNFNINSNIAFNRNKILEIDNQNDELLAGFSFYDANSIYRVGQPIGMFHGFVVDGIFETQDEINAFPSHPGNTVGTYRYRDVNGDGQITYDNQDWDIIGNPHPDFTWGFNLNMDYRQFDLSLGIVGMHGYDVYRSLEHFTMNVDGVFNTSTMMKDRWRSPENPGEGGWAGTGNFQFTREASSRFVYDASHTWIRNVIVGYTLPDFSEKFNLRVFASVDNLFLITDYPGNNPQADTTPNAQYSWIGVDRETYPIPRTFSFGLNLNL